MAKEFIHRYGILGIHQRGGPIAPDPPFLDVVCGKKTQLHAPGTIKAMVE